MGIFKTFLVVGIFETFLVVGIFERSVELSISSDSDANINEKDLVQSDPEIDEDSDEETLMI